jgi:hypothetical protein
VRVKMISIVFTSFNFNFHFTRSDFVHIKTALVAAYVPLMPAFNPANALIRFQLFSDKPFEFAV